MHRLRKDSFPHGFTPKTVYRTPYVLFGMLLACCLCAQQVCADDSGLANPAAKDFAEVPTATQKNGSVARKSSAFSDRSLPPPAKTETIQQVSASEGNPLNPFPTLPPPVVTQPLATQLPAAFDVGTLATGVPNIAASPDSGLGTANNSLVPPVAQNNVLFYDPYSGYANPYAQQQMYPADLSNFSLFAQQGQYPGQYPHQYPQGSMDPAMNQYAMGNMYAQYGYAADPYGMSAMGYGSQEMPDYTTLYQAVLFQEMARQQADGAKERASNSKEPETDETKKPADWTLNNLVPVRVTSPLGETLLVCAKTISPFSTPTGPDKGVGMPLVNKSWLDHPWYFGGFVGTVRGSDLVANMIKQKQGGTGGLVVGYNFNEYWGLESRLHFASIDIYDTDYARLLFEANYQTQFPGLAIPPLTSRTNELMMLDVAAHYYPLGNAKWRPFFKYGLGVGRQKYINTFGYEQSADMITMPLGLGVRYWWNERLAIQADLIDNVVFSSNIAKTQNNFAFTVGLTYSFGSGNKKHPFLYWPATPSMGSKW